ncbi:hypothetical protein QBC32DRAFT_399900 [Pseudoneurospora amorphoporcata]|uniref:DUF7580 domain-containing protein n=1 Tax=Pseudoneurospora amorphoporcata TaxID=241081 RepID=A0AAN6NPW6_9PEZI|nr:hypothetical protein QBC32DRAFT_399900 [Pseudoneurospora amorphoporcata]
MSGFEIASMVLGALPLAIDILDNYGELAKRCRDFHEIRAKYVRWRRTLKYSALLYKRNIEDLLLPLMVDGMDDDQPKKHKIIKLIKEPFMFGTWWVDSETVGILKERLRDGYEVYMDQIQEIRDVVEEITEELALNDSSVQVMVDKPWKRFKMAVKGEKNRTRLFKRLNDGIERLGKVLAGCDRLPLKHASVQSPVAVTVQPAAAIDSTLCSFWQRADRFFDILASSWNCRCTIHCANLLLQHRSNAMPEFEVLFTKEQSSKSSSATWNARKTRIVGNEAVNSEAEDAILWMSLPIHTLLHMDSRPLQSVMGNSGSSKGKATICAESQSSTTVMEIECEPSYSYLVDKNITYNIYHIPYQPAQQHIPITLQDIIEGDLFATLQDKRKLRFSIALTIASSFLQLLESPWLPTAITKTDIIFLVDPNPSGDILSEDEPAFLNEPYVQRLFVGKSPSRKKETARISDALDQLGTILVELGFGKRLQDQRYWRVEQRPAHSPRATTIRRGIYDFLTARDLQSRGKLLEKAGPDYAAAVDWCLGMNRPGQGGGDLGTWRKDVLNHVVGRLKLCCDFLSGEGLDD